MGCLFIMIIRKMAKITVDDSEITVVRINDEDYLSLTDMMKANDGEFFFHNWLRNRNTIEFLGIWEKVYNPNFNSVEFDRIKSMAGLNNFRISAKEWIESTKDLLTKINPEKRRKIIDRTITSWFIL